MGAARFGSVATPIKEQAQSLPRMGFASVGYAAMGAARAAAKLEKQEVIKHQMGAWSATHDDGPRASPLASFAVGGGISEASVGRSALFVLLSNDASGRALHLGGAPWSVHVTGPGKVLTSVVDHDDGTVTVRYTTWCSGLHRVYVRLDDAHIAGSPFDVHVNVGAPAPSVITAMMASQVIHDDCMLITSDHL